MLVAGLCFRMTTKTNCSLLVSDGTVYHGYSFGFTEDADGEIGRLFTIQTFTHDLILTKARNVYGN